MNKGKLIQVMGSVFDAKFAPEHVPALYNAVEVQVISAPAKPAFGAKSNSTSARVE